MKFLQSMFSHISDIFTTFLHGRSVDKSQSWVEFEAYFDDSDSRDDRK
jgi:hypothetical protein